MRFLSKLEIEWLTHEEARRERMGSAAARVINPLRFESNGHRLYVPARFVTDHASVPRLFWNIFPPVDPRWSRAAVVHDYGYRFGAYPIEGGNFLRFGTRAGVDNLFLAAMEADGAGWLARHTLYRAVRMGGWATWNKYRKEEQIMVEQIKRVQKVVGVTADGIAGPITWRAVAARIGIDVTGLMIADAIRRVQACLGVAVDGIAGPQTLGAVERFINSPAGMPPAVAIDERSERNIGTLIPVAQEAARRWLLACLAAGLNIKIIDGSRTYAEQDALYAQGRTKPGAAVTNAQGGQSLHNFGIAWDFGIFGPHGEYITDNSDYDRAGVIAESLDLEWGGRWRSPVDRPHVQVKTGLTLAEMRARVAAGKRAA